MSLILARIYRMSSKFMKTQHPPRSALFPYTTLFRSSHEATHARIHTEPVLARHIAFARVDQELVDRKSTRLNSSHVKISYAVFCFKKKKLYRQIWYPS